MDQIERNNDQTREGNGGKGERDKQKAADIEKARQEIKRNREQQRRNALNDGLDKLLELIFEIDPDLKAEAQLRARQSSYRGRVPTIELSLLSRVEILDQGIMTLRRIHRENEDRKVALARVAKENPSAVPAAVTAVPPPPPPNRLVNHSPRIPANTNAQDIQGLQQQLNLLAASSSAAPSGLANLANLQASLGLGSFLPHLQGAAAIDLVLQARNSAAGAASLLALHQSPNGGGSTSTNSNHPFLNSDQKTTLPGDSAFYRDLLDRKIREEKAAAALTAALQNAYAMPPVSLFGAPQSNTSERETLGQVAVQRAPVREQTIAEAAAAKATRRLHHGPRDEYGPESKRMKHTY